VAAGKRRLQIVITAGPTREYLDTVRFISNASSGKMGFAIAEAAAAAGHRVTLISGPVSLAPPSGVRLLRVISATQMALATKRAFRDADAGVFAAAVSDYRPKRRAASKAPKSTSAAKLSLEPTEDIAAAIGRVKGDRITVGFALEDRLGKVRAARKRAAKNFDAIILNDPSNVGSDLAAADFLDRSGKWSHWPRQSKRAMARRIVRFLERSGELRLNSTAKGMRVLRRPK
jgi:phosphopantothenoylcysteine decarboxylase/phosphopantothenate--cysteine ligase